MVSAARVTIINAHTPLRLNFRVSTTASGRDRVPGSAQLRRIGRAIQLGAGLLLLGVGYWIGRVHLDLIRSGVRTQGQIVAFKTESFRSHDSELSSTGQYPIVEYHIGDHAVRFEDWLAGRRNERKADVVRVIYDASRPTIAMIDRPVWNWMPWAPIAAVGALLALSGLVGLTRRGARRADR